MDRHCTPQHGGRHATRYKSMKQCVIEGEKMTSFLCLQTPLRSRQKATMPSSHGAFAVDITSHCKPIQMNLRLELMAVGGGDARGLRGTGHAHLPLDRDPVAGPVGATGHALCVGTPTPAANLLALCLRPGNGAVVWSG